MKPTTPTQYHLSPEFFARRRQSLTQRKAELFDLLKQMDAIDEQIARLDADEKLVAEVTARYEPDIALALPKKRGPQSRPTPSRPVPSGRPWTPDELAAVAAGDPANDEALAQQLDRKPGSIAKRRRKILRAGDAGEAHADPGPTPPPEPEVVIPSDPEPVYDHTSSVTEDPLEGVSSSSEKPEISEPTKPVMTDSERRVPRSLPPKPGLPVRGAIDNGPLDRRYYDPIYDASRESR